MLDAESLLTPLSEASPSGSDLEYDDAFRAMEEAGEDKPETEWGDRIYPARPPDWLIVHTEALKLAAQTRDLRVAVWLTRSSARLSGLPGYVDGLRLIHGLVERYWETLHPALDASEENDPTARLNALLPLGSFAAGLADLRAARLTGERGGLTVRSIELAFHGAEPVRDESVPTESGVLEGIGAAVSDRPDVLLVLGSVAELLAAIVGTLMQHVPATALPDFEALQKLGTILERAADRVDASALAAVGGVAPGGRAGGEIAIAGPGNGAIATREEAVEALERVCTWLERHEPSNPAPLLIRRSQRLMNKNFLDIIRDLAPDTLDQIEKLAGIPHS